MRARISVVLARVLTKSNIYSSEEYALTPDLHFKEILKNSFSILVAISEDQSKK